MTFSSGAGRGSGELEKDAECEVKGGTSDKSGERTGRRLGKRKEPRMRRVGDEQKNILERATGVTRLEKYRSTY